MPGHALDDGTKSQVRWFPYALDNLLARDIDQAEARRAIAAPEYVMPNGPARDVYMRRDFDTPLGQEMLLRVGGRGYRRRAGRHHRLQNIPTAEVSEKANILKVAYDAETDSLTITLRADAIRESDEIRLGVIADFGEDGGIVRFEILRASTVVSSPRLVELTTAG